jgi:hypothetical protein
MAARRAIGSGAPLRGSLRVSAGGENAEADRWVETKLAAPGARIERRS